MDETSKSDLNTRPYTICGTSIDTKSCILFPRQDEKFNINGKNNLSYNFTTQFGLCTAAPRTIKLDKSLDAQIHITENREVVKTVIDSTPDSMGDIISV